MKTLTTASIATMIGATLLVAASYSYARDTGRGTGPVIYVTSQGLYYDSIVLKDLPKRGKFQKLEMEGPTGLQTEFGPGDPGHRGGRWWVDANGDDVMDRDDAYFLCPLLGPGRVDP